MAKSTIAPYGEAEHRVAIARGMRTKMSPTAVLHARYDPVFGSLVLDLNNGAHVALPIEEIRELRAYSAVELAQVVVSPGRDGLLWCSIDVGISASGLLTDFFGSAVSRATSAPFAAAAPPQRKL